MKYNDFKPNLATKTQASHLTFIVQCRGVHIGANINMVEFCPFFRLRLLLPHIRDVVLARRLLAVPTHDADSQQHDNSDDGDDDAQNDAHSDWFLVILVRVVFHIPYLLRHVPDLHLQHKKNTSDA